MADNNESEQQITFNVKSSAEAKYVLTVPTSTTIGDLKQKLSQSDYAGIPSERQRLIYSGRVLKDNDTVAGVKIKDGNTVHLVRGAESNQRQAPANQGGSSPAPSSTGQPASNVPSNIAAGTGTGNPLAHLTGARYAGFHGLPGADMFGADGGMGAPPNADQMLRLLDDPNFAQQMNEAMNNPAVLDMFRNSPMIRNNPVARAVMENPELRRMMFSPDMIRMQMQMQRSMGEGGRGAGEGAFPMPGQTDTTPSSGNNNAGSNETQTQGNAATNNPAPNPFAALFAPPPTEGNDNNNGNTGSGGAAAQPPFGSLFGLGAGSNGGGQNQDPLAEMTQRMAQNPQMMQQMMNLFGGGAGGEGGGSGGFNPFAAFGEPAAPQSPPDNRPPEERYAEQLRQLNDMGFYEFERNVQALRRSGGSVQGAVEYLLSQPAP